MSFRALVFDLDGTAIPKKPDGMPSQAVIDVLHIDDLCIVNGGTHLYSGKAYEYV